jgi:cytochrome b subunit of formate dehydrogenase
LCDGGFAEVRFKAVRSLFGYRGVLQEVACMVFVLPWRLRKEVLERQDVGRLKPVSGS